ncbi:MAG: mannose-1-phosphate guanylyltransferase/mannose-6-phosphate isomerase [Gammaproteobacteria bacterium]|nr:mannose-1-phosphate guanylyltransferase/mannose-6-phosphate isomerase [Gammaproteobacteria bacterium]NIR84451.1 mannose-1-phosphate guanylyltransferase/mannose-6-phosphate isomerase [Gammaproteobacteria bacterium]NIR90932.1 mannose-1-phosphate guanylyltransferase/mannose-6-phosphate isomerase [Gammaproteobacteria bacterium]NIU07118.1 mannose-1-phosphate guanylyltransferase/mannose-6-phosphate isomerase [Gammaproteobacteria bacterium]NIV76247.1 mannose-1-phosphate guanylyltransferase/mannose-
MSTSELSPVILAGGVGSRLWPLSREGYPKQLLRLLEGAHTLLQETALRLEGLAAAHRGESVVNLNEPIVVCHEDHRFFVLDQLQSIGGRAARLVLEPASRNTAPALTLAALAASEGGADPALLAMPADHVIRDRERFHEAILAGASLAEAGVVVTFGIVPGRPETGYGYIRKGPVLDEGAGREAFAIREFVEKPDRETAAAYLASGEYLWNGGLFMMRASVWLDAIARYRPQIAGICRQAYAGGRADGAFYRVNRDLFAECPKESIDYAVMESLARDAAAHPTPSGFPNAAVIALDAGWDDIGSWPALMQLNDADGEGNVLIGDAYAQGTRESLLVSEHRFLAGVGLENLIVVETPDAVLVASRDRCQDVGDVVDWLNRSGRGEARNGRRVYRPWGNYESLDAGERFQVKRLTIKPGESISLQMHHHRAEHWVVVRGTARVTRGDEQFFLSENESTYIPVGARHRLENPGRVPLEVIEVQSGSYLGEDDIVRFEDPYNRDPHE